jgi:Meiotically Up-regulated Gene 113 (MUG113) protein
MDRDTYLKEIRDRAARNGGRPLGVKSFFRATGTSRSDLFDVGFATYSAAVRAAGLQPNKLTSSRDDHELLGGLARLTRSLGRFPAQSDLKVARRSDSSLPSYEALSRLSGGWRDRLPALLVDFCFARDEFRDVVQLIDQHAVPRAETTETTRARVRGYVYLARHGTDYKIGRSNDVTRRRRELALILPRELEHVHIIETDDPEGIEAYWHNRFRDRRIRGEWFELRPEDVVAFRRRKYQ